MKSEYLLLLFFMLFTIIELVLTLFILIPIKDEYIGIQKVLLADNGRVDRNDYLYKLIKRLFDIVISFIVLIMMFPLLAFIALVMLLMRVHNPLVKNKYIGYHRNIVNVYKFNVCDTNGNYTKIGYFLWKSGLDLLPVFYSVLMGDITLIGLRKISICPSKDEQNLLSLYNYEKPGMLSVSKFIHIKDFTSNEIEILYLKSRDILFDLKLFHYMVRKALFISVK